MVEKEIEKAKDLYGRFGEAILCDRNLVDLLEGYRRSIGATWDTMRHLGMVRGCAICATEEAGSCCFNGAEEWYDYTLIFINLLLGVQIPKSREILDGCLFVGKTGCKLIARYCYCINYLCTELKDSIDSSYRKNLMAVTGKEIFCGWRLEQSIREWINLNR